MTDQRIEGAAEQAVGKTQNGLGRLTGDRRQQLEGHLTEYKGKARQGLDFARRKPLLTTGIVAGLAVLLGALGRRR